jgi:Tol biopolymer transport system component
MKKLILLALILSFGLFTEQTNADYTFGTSANLGPIVNSSALDAQPCISADGLSLFFHSERPGGYGDRDIWVARRTAKYEGWTMLENIGPPVNTSYRDSGPDISADGLTLFFDSDRPGGSGESDIWVTTRTTKSDPWGTPVNLGPIVNASSYDAYPSVSADGLILFMQSYRPGGYGGYDIWMATRQTENDPWATPVNLGPSVNSSAIDGDPCISPDGLVLFFTSLRPGGYGIADLYLVRRATIQDSWGPPMNLGPVVNNSPDQGQGNPSISADGLILYFASGQSGGEGDWDLWQAPIIPIVDLNGDGIVDAADMCIIVDHWGENNPLCDIGPMPWGDGVVDVQDLIVLAEHLFDEIFPPGLVAYWKLDEAEGNLANNSISDNHGVLHGEPFWQQHSGMKSGALEFDGINDYVETGFVLNPAESSFSALVWIKGGSPGQVILSQTDGTGGAGDIWLGADAVEGKLMTKLRSPSGRSPAPPMVADVVITDGQWHHVGIVITEQKVRYLYVDGIRVAFDTQPVLLPPSDGGLHIGSGKNLEAGTFFSGLIDDIRIYDVALTAEEIVDLTK